MNGAIFRFDAEEHVYSVEGCVVPHITGMLDRTGWIDDTWYTEESCERGQMVHTATADYDLGALDVASYVSKYRGYLLSHIKAVSMIVGLDWLAVEEPMVHSRLRFGGRPDRRLVAYGLRGVFEGKSGPPERSHQIQTALQAILVSDAEGIPPEQLARFCLYWKDNGKFKLEEHTERRDFDEARRIIRVCCGT